MMKLLLLLLFLSPSRIGSFNLDPRIPIIKRGGIDSESFFGFSVAQHRTAEGETLLLVGAPRDQNLQPGTNRSGALWKCGWSAGMEVSKSWDLKG